MRALFAAAVVMFGVAGVIPARAADLVEPGAVIGDGSIDGGLMPYAGYSVDGVRAGPVIIYDVQPGVIRRTWFLSPWHHHHFFPATGEKPRSGRREDLSARSDVQPAESFYRSWSTNDLFPYRRAPVRVRARALDDEGVARIPQAPEKP